jgi:hypothetical protein
MIKIILSSVPIVLTACFEAASRVWEAPTLAEEALAFLSYGQRLNHSVDPNCSMSRGN